MSRGELLQALAARISTLQPGHPSRVAVDGPDAAGKSTLADDLQAVLSAHRPVIRLSIDDFHHREHVRRRRGDLSPEGYYFDAFNIEAVIDGVLRPLGPGGTGTFRPSSLDYHRDVETEAVPQTAPRNAVVLFDGVFLLRPELRPFWDFSVYLHISPEETLRRALVRDRPLLGSEERIVERYACRYLPGQALYRREVAPTGVCDALIDMSEPNKPILLRQAPAS